MHIINDNTVGENQPTNSHVFKFLKVETFPS